MPAGLPKLLALSVVSDCHTLRSLDRGSAGVRSMQMKEPRIPVDFNEMLESDLVLLSQTDTRVDSSGATVVLSEGLSVLIYDDDTGADGQPNYLIASGTVEKNTSDASWGQVAKWCCRIDSQGIRHQSEI